MRTPDLLSVHDPAAVARVAALAREIWTEHYLPIIGAAQVEYMLERFQSEKAIAEQIADGMEYGLLVEGDEDVGYLAVKPEADGLFLSKLYVRADRRGRGYGRLAMDHVLARTRALGLGRIRLTVNRGNAAAIAAYRALGFAVTKDLVADIGGGFVMDDHAMERPVSLP